MSEPSPLLRRLLVGVGLLAVGACGVSGQSQPVPIAALDGPTIPAVHPAHRTTQVSQSRTIFLVDGTRLAGVTRAVPVAAGVEGALRALEEAPSPGDAARGLRSALPAGGGHLHARVGDGVAVVAVPRSYESLGLVQQVLAVGQIVYTVTGIDGITGVELTSDDQVIDVPVDRGQLRSGPVSRADYLSIAPRRR